LQEDREDALTVERHLENPAKKMAPVAEVFIGSLSVRMSILAMSLLMRPYTVTQTDQNTVKSSCNRAGHTFFVGKAALAQPDVKRTAADRYGSLLIQSPDHLVERDVLRLFSHAEDEVLVSIQAMTVQIPIPNRAAA